jgi:hypothetical protein
MMKQFSLTTTINQAAPIFGAAALSGLAFFAMPGVAQAADIGAGIDKVVTQNGTFFNLGPPIGEVEFMGEGGADTWIERKEDCDFVDGKCHVDIEVIKLDLISKAPVNIGGDLYDIDIDLKPNDPSVGEMWINEDGTFESDFMVHFNANFIALNGGPERNPVMLWKDFIGGGKWRPDDNGNLILVGDVVHDTGEGDGLHIVRDVPEPLTTLASLTGLGFGAILKRKNDKKQQKA